MQGTNNAGREGLLDPSDKRQPSDAQGSRGTTKQYPRPNCFSSAARSWILNADLLSPSTFEFLL